MMVDDYGCKYIVVNQSVCRRIKPYLTGHVIIQETIYNVIKTLVRYTNTKYRVLQGIELKPLEQIIVSDFWLFGCNFLE